MDEFLLKYFILIFGLGPLVISSPILMLLYKYLNIFPTWYFFNFIFKFEELTVLSKKNYELKKTKNADIEVIEEDSLNEDDDKNKKTNVTQVYSMNDIGKFKGINVSQNILISKDLPHFYINNSNIRYFKRKTAILGFIYLYILYIMFIRLVIMESRTSEVCLDGYYCSNLPKNLTCNDLSTNTTDLDENKKQSSIELYCITLKSFYDVFFIQLPLFYGTIKILKFINIIILKIFYNLFKKLVLCFNNENLFFDLFTILLFCFPVAFLLIVVIIEAIDDVNFADRFVEVVAWIDFCFLTASFPAFLWNKRLSQKLLQNDSKSFSINIRNIAFIEKNKTK